MVTPARMGGAMSITVAPKTTTAVGAKRGKARGPAAEKEAGSITIRAQWTIAVVEESRARESIAIIIHTGNPEGATGL